MSDDSIRIFSLNCWGLKYVSRNRVERVHAIADFLSTASYDLVCLQELWARQDFETICASVSHRLPFVKLFHSGAVGAGLAIFSRFPIVAASMQVYSLNGSPLDFKGADWFAGKAAASVVLEHPLLGDLQVFNTHLFSEGGDDGPEHNRAHRLVNAWEFAKLVKQSAEIGRYVIAAGDFNSVPSTLPMTVVYEHAGLTDAWGCLHSPPPQDHRSDIDPADAISLYGFTYDSPLNSYTVGKSYFVPRGKRLDYVLFRNPTPSVTPSSASSTSLPKLVPTATRVLLTNLVPGKSFSYSDHYGVEATFKIENLPKKVSSLVDQVAIDGNPPTASSDAVPTNDQNSQLSREHTSVVIHALQTRLGHAIVEARNYMRVYFTSVVLLVVLLIGTGWSPKGYLTPVFVFLGSILTYIGTTAFYVGFLYGRWEANALRNAIEELELFLAQRRLK
ncbi:phospholipase C type enzyme [Marasmius tenuissimus]|uniref:Phospholipase C type enzyme n=1 Tax=Marasmius tenuissimus TaxID=585030 RepID=A0ABR3A086_9AGAR